MRGLEREIAAREGQVGELRAQLVAIEADAARSAEERDAARREVEGRLAEAQAQVGVGGVTLVTRTTYW